MKTPQPVVVVSRCLIEDGCRYDGGSSVCRGLISPESRAEFIAVCPEVALGLPVPREPLRLVRVPGGRRVRLVQPATGLDLTRRMTAFAERFLRSLARADVFVLKSRSPSCAVSDAKVFDSAEAEEPACRRPGLFAARVIERFAGVPVIDEETLASRGGVARLLERPRARTGKAKTARRGRDGR